MEIDATKFYSCKVCGVALKGNEIKRGSIGRAGLGSRGRVLLEVTFQCPNNCKPPLGGLFKELAREEYEASQIKYNE